MYGFSIDYDIIDHAIALKILEVILNLSKK